MRIHWIELNFVTGSRNIPILNLKNYFKTWLFIEIIKSWIYNCNNNKYSNYIIIGLISKKYKKVDIVSNISY